MIKNIFVHLMLVCVSITTSLGHASNALSACEALQEPFVTLTQLVSDPAVNNPPKVQLCHRVANAAKHYEQDRISKAVDELNKFINETQTSTPRHINTSYAGALVAEAERVIGLIDGSIGPLLGQVSGGVFTFDTKVPVSGALVTLSFLGEDQVFTTHSGENGLFLFEDLPPSGTFIITADDGSGATGSMHGAILEAELNTSVSVLVDQSGNGSIQGNVTSSDGSAAADSLVSAFFPDSGRQYTVIAGVDGFYSFSGLQTDGTVILIAFDNNSGASASYSSVLTSWSPSRTISLELEQPEVINSELTNTGFVNGTSGWSVQGPVQIIDRDIIFSAQN